MSHPMQIGHCVLGQIVVSSPWAPKPTESKPMIIKVRYASIDGYKQTKSYSTLAGARAFAQHWVGQNPEMGSSYAVSGDGVGKITLEFVSFWPAGSEKPVKLADLFGDGPMTLTMAKALVKPLGFTLTAFEGEYRLAPIAGTPAQKEARAHYTEDLDDAIGTAKAEARRAAEIEAEVAQVEVALYEPMSVTGGSNR